MISNSTKLDGTDQFYNKVKLHMKRVRKDVAENDKRQKQAVRDWFYGKK